MKSPTPPQRKPPVDDWVERTRRIDKQREHDRALAKGVPVEHELKRGEPTMSTHQLPISDVLEYAIEVFKDEKSDDALALAAAQVIGTFLVATELTKLAEALAVPASREGAT
jgi:hypothetical protein